MGNILAIISAVKEVIALIKMVIAWVKTMKAAQAIKEGEEKAKAIDDAVNAKTPQEAMDAQKKLDNPDVN